MALSAGGTGNQIIPCNLWGLSFAPCYSRPSCPWAFPPAQTCFFSASRTGILRWAGNRHALCSIGWQMQPWYHLSVSFPLWLLSFQIYGIPIPPRLLVRLFSSVRLCWCNPCWQRIENHHWFDCDRLSVPVLEEIP